MNFDEWWERCGIESSASRRDLAAEAFAAAKAQSGNYVCDRPVKPTEVTFANGRKVKLMPEDGEEAFYLEVGWAKYMGVAVRCDEV
jgi:hypothetical protein